uniref:Major facilitator superfamily associated domain-containing protein n=1 Tax=Strigamia maritima TaxID=126957 RepID=T1ISK9_STRMM
MWTGITFGCIWPFLTVHMKSLGFTLEEITIINMVIPFTSLLGPPCAGALAAKLGRRRLVLVLCLLLAGISFSALLFVPPIYRQHPRSPTATLTCGPKAGIIHLERCNNRCELKDHNYQLEFKNCIVSCSSDAQPQSQTPIALPPPPEGEIVPPDATIPEQKPEKNDTIPVLAKPILCFNKRPHECHVYNASGTDESVVLYLNHLFLVHSTDKECQYQLRTFTRPRSSDIFEGMQCQLPSKLCHVKCDITETSKPAIMQSPQCIETEGDPFLTFWLYFFIRVIAELFPQSCLALMDAIILNMVHKHKGQYGKQILFGIAAIGIFPPVVGFFSDLFSDPPYHMDYTPAFITFDALLLISAILVVFLDTERTDYMPRLCKNVGKVLKNAELVTLFFVIFILGSQFGFIETFLYLDLQSQGASLFLLGLTLTAGVVPSLPFLFIGDVIVRKCGKANLLITALFVYSLRFTGYAYIPGPWWALLFETLEVFTLNLMWLSTVTYCAQLSPRLLLPTTMGLAIVMHYNAGRGVGTLIGGYAMDKLGTRVAYQGSAILSGCVGLIYFAIYHFHLKEKRTPNQLAMVTMLLGIDKKQMQLVCTVDQ